MPAVVLRRTRGGEVAQLCALANRALVHDRIPQVLDEQELVEELAALDSADDVRVAEVDGALAGYSYVWFTPSGERLERAFVFGKVDPAQRGAGVGTALVEWGVARATALLRATGNGLPKYVLAEAYDQVADAHRLLHCVGFMPARYFEELLRPLDELPPLAVDDAYEVVDWPLDRAEELRTVRNIAFADHWGSTPWTAQRLREVTEQYGARLDLSVAAIERASGQIVALSFNSNYPQDAAMLGRTDGWIEVLATLAAHRGRGLASALVSASLRRFRAAGFTHASIGVDSASPTGANRLYRSLGFELEQGHTTYEMLLS